MLFKLGSHQSHHVTDLITNNTSLFHQAVTLQNISINSITPAGCRSKNKTYEINGTLLGDKSKEANQCNGHLLNGTSNLGKKSTCNRDQCSMSPDNVRYEAECLRTDFNLRMKQILFNSLISAYYVAFIPLKFTQVRDLRFV